MSSSSLTPEEYLVPDCCRLVFTTMGSSTTVSMTSGTRMMGLLGVDFITLPVTTCLIVGRETTFLVAAGLRTTGFVCLLNTGVVLVDFFVDVGLGADVLLVGVEVGLGGAGRG